MALGSRSRSSNIMSEYMPCVHKKVVKCRNVKYKNGGKFGRFSEEYPKCERF